MKNTHKSPTKKIGSGIKNAKARIASRLLLSRSFLILAGMTALPELISVSVMTFNPSSSAAKSEIRFLAWSLVGLTWLYVILKVAFKYWMLKQEENDKDS